MTYTQPATADFLSESPTAYPLFYRTYSRRTSTGDRESWDEVAYRTVVKGLREIGKLTHDETELLLNVVGRGLAFPSGRWLWVGGTEWLEKPENFPGAFNCTSQPVNGRPEDPWEAIASTMDLAMMGSGTGVVLEPQYVEKLPAIARRIDVTVADSVFSRPKPERAQLSTLEPGEDLTHYTLTVGDSRAGWVGAYKHLLYLASTPVLPDKVTLQVDLSHVRKKGERLEGFGGVANPIRLGKMFENLAQILNGATGRKLTPLEACLVVDEAAACVVAGNLRRSAGMKQFATTDPLHKKNLWKQEADGTWRIDPTKDALRMSNHTRVYHTRPSRTECVEAVREQFYSGEGAIQFAPESIARASADILDTDPLREQFIEVYTSQGREAARQFLLDSGAEDADVDHRLERYGLNPCVTGDTWVLTDEGPRQVRSLVGRQHGTYVNGEIFSTTRAGFFSKGKKPIVRVETAEGYTLKLTPDHMVQKLVVATQRRSYGHWVAVSELEPGDRIFIHNHREATPWTGWGTREEGWEFGRKLAADRVLVKRYGGPPLAVSSADEKRATFKDIPRDIEKSSYEFHQGFLQGIFDEWCVLKAPIRHGTALVIKHPHSTILEQMQRMLLRLGIVCSVTEPQINPRGLRTPATLTISRDNLIQFKEVIGFSDPDKQNELELLLGNYQRHPDRERFTAKIQSIKPAGSEEVFDCQVPGPACFDANGFVAHNCGEIIGSTFACNLAEVHLNRIAPLDLPSQEDAFRAGALSVCALLQRGFTDPRFQWSRELDPIVAVCFTGGFDFFVQALGTDWLRWWQAGRPGRWGEEVFWEPLLETPHRHPGQLMRQSSFFRTRELEYLEFWRGIVEDTVEDYCHRHGLKKPNRATAIQPSGSKSLLTGASPGWHPPKAQRFIRRMTFGKNDPVALACLDFGYSVVPSQSDKDEDGRLLDDPFDPRCTEWLVEIPVEVPWANLPGASDIDISSFSALAQFDFYMQIQRHYVRHNCFSRDTRFLTGEGIKTFEDFEVGNDVTVLNADGDWVPAKVVNTVHPRTMLAITIREGKTGKLKTIKSTHCHRFPVRRISPGESKIKIVQASELKIGHRLVLNSADLPALDADGIRHGIVFGDGSRYKDSKGEYHAAQLYLCGGKRHLQSYFESFERTYERDDIDQTRIYGLPVEWKYLPQADCTQSYLAGFIAGLLATDGNVSHSTISVSTGRQDVVDYLIEQTPRIGIKLSGYHWFSASGYKESGGAFQVRFSKSTFPENMIIRPHHLEHFRSHDSQPCQWRVVDIAEAETQVGWCVMEPKTNHFTLEDNILVMNTSATIELREDEIEPLGDRIYEAIQRDEGYISAALLARFDAKETFPRLPFEPIDKSTYERLQSEVLQRRKSDDFHALLAQYDKGAPERDSSESGPAGCDSDKCLMPQAEPGQK